jgi:hypothetical protein
MGPSQRYALVQSFQYRDAELLLQRHHVRSRIACYVNPNARCPVCDDPVFFYANAAGSRVYFDDLGPPWPKHGCTDRGIPTTASPQIARRSGGLTQELLKAANIIGMFDHATGHEATSALSPIIILDVITGAQSTVISGEHIGILPRRGFTARVRGHGFSLKSGDIVGEQNGIISYVDPITLKPMQFRDGGEPEPFQSLQVTAESALITRPAASQAVLIRGRLSRTGKPSKPEPSGDLTADEIRHFGGDEQSLGKLLSIYVPLIRQYAREQTRKPKDVCQRLNREGHKTMAGEAWTNRLVFFLLKLLFERETPAAAKQKPPPERGLEGTKRPISKPASSPSQTSTTDTLIAKLGHLGRVTIGKPRNA